MAIVTSGLIGYWNAKQGISGSKWSNIAPGKTGLNDGTMANVTLTNGVPTFNGSTSKVTIPFSGVTNFTFEFFVTPNNTGGAHGIFGSDGNNRLMVEGPGDVGLKLGGTSYYGNTGLILFGQVNHIAIVVTPTSAKWYVNGVLDQNYTISAAFAWGTSFILGWVSSGYYLNGLIHSAKLYDRLLTDPEISQNYSNGVEVGLTTSVEQTGVANLLGLGLLSADGQVTSNVNSSANLLGVGILTATAITTSQSAASANFVGTGVLTATGIQIINSPVIPVSGSALYVTDIYGNMEMLSGYKGLKRFRRVSGDKTLAFLILPTNQNSHSFDMVQEESIVEFDGDTYRIKQMNEKNKGQTYYKEVVAIHTFFDLIDQYVYETFTGSKTFAAFLQFVFAGTSYTWDIVDSFYAQDWENLGDNNQLTLFQNGLKRYGAEFTLSGTHLTFKQKIGYATDFQLRYNYNIKTINRQVNTKNLSTYIKGFGKKNEDGSYLVQSDYTSPNVNIFGIRHAKPVNDERYTTLEGLNERLIAEIMDTPELSITLDFVDLRRAGFPYDVPGEGDDVFLIYEPMNLDLETRIIDITEEFSEFSDYPIKTDVTLANFRNKMTEQFVEFSRTQKTVDGVMNGSKKIPYNALDDAVKRATTALQSAQTELEFNNGIIGRSKTDPNQLTLFNSAGFGISKDGGQTFTEAITSQGFNLSAGAIGQLEANNIQIGAETTFETGYDPHHGEIYVRGTGLNRSANRLLKINGQTIFDETGTRGLRYIEIDKTNFTYVKQDYDTYGNETDRNSLADRINYVCDTGIGNLVVLLSFDAIDWNDALKAAVRRIGGSNFPTNRTPYALIGLANINEGSAIQMITGQGSNDPFAEITTRIVNGTVQGINTQAATLRDDLRLTAPLPTSITLNQDGFRATTPSDQERYFQADYRGAYVKKGAIQIERDDGFITMIDGKLNQSFDVFGSDPPYMVDTHMNGRYFQLNSGIQQGTCQIYTLDRKARYLKLQVTLGSEVAGSGCTFFVTSTSDNNTWLGSYWTTNGYDDPGQSWITLDLGIPDGSEYAIYCLIRSDNPSYFCQGRITRIKQTDFL